MIDPTGAPRSAVLVDGDRMVGGSADDIEAFKGIPFAVPLSKNLHWRARYQGLWSGMKRFNQSWVHVVPGLFVFLWSTGFIGARFGLPYAEPFTFLFVRFLFTLAVLFPVALITRARWPRQWPDIGHIAVSGLLVHAAYLGGVFAAIRLGMPAGLTALIVGVQPLLTAVVARAYLGDSVSRLQWAGLLLGFAGGILVLGEKMLAAGTGSFSSFGLGGLLFALAALLGISFGTLYQKQFCADMDLRTGAIIQYLASTVAMGLIAVTTETMEIQWTAEFIFALVWLVVMLSLGAISLLTLLIRRGAASEVASLFYLVPPATAAEAFLLFGERLGLMALVGMVPAALGVAMAVGRLDEAVFRRLMRRSVVPRP
jgi:drug/metabolite transporter (DMT)-like permease